jgi:hypothetical protein
MAASLFMKEELAAISLFLYVSNLTNRYYRIKKIPQKFEIIRVDVYIYIKSVYLTL